MTIIILIFLIVFSLLILISMVVVYYKNTSANIKKENGIILKEKNSVIKKDENIVLKNSIKSETKSINEEKWTTEIAISKIEIINQRDDFEGTNIIHFSNVVNEGTGFLPMYYTMVLDFVSSSHLGISFFIYKKNVFIEVFSNIPDMNLAKGDRLILLFENGEKTDITFQNAKSSRDLGNSNYYLILPYELKKIASFNLDKWKLKSSRKKVFVAGDNTLFPSSCKINDRKTTQEILKFMANAIAAEYLKIYK